MIQRGFLPPSWLVSHENRCLAFGAGVKNAQLSPPAVCGACQRLTSGDPLLVMRRERAYRAGRASFLLHGAPNERCDAASEGRTLERSLIVLNSLMRVCGGPTGPQLGPRRGGEPPSALKLWSSYTWRYGVGLFDSSSRCWLPSSYCCSATEACRCVV